MSEKHAPTVFVVDDDKAMGSSLRWLLESVGLNVETYATAQAYLDACDPTAPGCLLLDIRMPGMSGLELQRQLIGRSVRLPIIFITGHGDVPTAVQALQAGAMDFVEKPFSGQALLDRVLHAIERDAQLRRERADCARIESRLAALTPREREVLDLVVAGQPNKAIAANLNLSPKTVETHRAKVMAKMGAASLSDLVRAAITSARAPGKP